MYTGYPPSLWKDKLNTALNCYNEALKFAKNDDEKSSVWKNIGMANEKFLETNITKIEKVFYANEALKAFNNAIGLGKTKSFDWIQFILGTSMEIINKILELYNSSSKRERIDLLYKIRNQVLNMENCLLEINYTLANLLFQEAVIYSEEKQYNNAINTLENCIEPLMKAQILSKKSKKSDHYEDMVDLDHRRLIHLHRAQGLKEKNNACKLIKNILENDDKIYNDELWQAIDQFSYSLIIIKGHDIELEAEVHSHLGSVFYDILKLEDRAIHHYEACLSLANTLVPRLMTTVSWYKKALDSLKIIQEKHKMANEKLEADAYDQMKKKYAEILGPAIKEISEKSESLESKKFLEFLNEKYPPPLKHNTKVKLEESTNVKKLIQIALVNYHPDKNTNQDEKWQFLALEITKYLNYHYSLYKQAGWITKQAAQVVKSAAQVAKQAA